MRPPRRASDGPLTWNPYLGRWDRSPRVSVGLVAPAASAPAPTAASNTDPPPDDSSLFSGLGKAIQNVTPTLIVVGVFTGAAFAIGSGLVSRYVFDHGRRRR